LSLARVFGNAVKIIVELCSKFAADGSNFFDGIGTH